MTRLDEFEAYRSRMNDRILEVDHLGIKRFFNLDTKAYEDSALDSKTKELLGLVASFVLRCDDCIKYHIIRCHEEGVVIRPRDLAEALLAKRPVVGERVRNGRRLDLRRGRGRRRRKQKVEIIQPATIGEDIPVSTSDGIDLRRLCASRPNEHPSIMLQRLGLELPRSLETTEM